MSICQSAMDVRSQPRDPVRKIPRERFLGFSWRRTPWLFFCLLSLPHYVQPTSPSEQTGRFPGGSAILASRWMGSHKHRLPAVPSHVHFRAESRETSTGKDNQTRVSRPARTLMVIDTVYRAISTVVSDHSAQCMYIHTHTFESAVHAGSPRSFSLAHSDFPPSMIAFALRVALSRP